jgi:hypothetical protein
MHSDQHLNTRVPILALWSAPRSRSTAFARMMAERGDFTMLHEPFSHVVNFGESEVGDQLVRSEQELIGALLRMAQDGPLFFKDTTDFYYPRLLADTDFLAAGVHTPMKRYGRIAVPPASRL